MANPSQLSENIELELQKDGWTWLHKEEDREQEAETTIQKKQDRNADSGSAESLLLELPTDKPKQYSHEDLISFTSNFSDKIGFGGAGDVYKGQLPSGAQVAVKVLRGKDIVRETFMTEVKMMGKTYNPNLIKLYGFCFDQDMKALVSEYMENGSLDKILYENRHNLEWGRLYDIATETARGITYLHDGCHEQIIHHDVKAANVLLDSKFSPKVADFGLAKIMNRDVSHFTLTRVKGTPGYVAPEMWMPSSQVTYKCDVYSFGMLLFEVLGRRNNSQDSQWFPRQVWDKYENGKLDEIIEECGLNTDKDRVKARVLSIVALWCSQFTAQVRPSMSIVVKMLENEIQLGTPPNPFFPASLPSSPQPSHSQEVTHPEEVASTATHELSDALLDSYAMMRPPGGKNAVIIYTDSAEGGINFDKCSEVLSILRSHKIEMIERDIAGNPEIEVELHGILGGTKLPPILFVKQRYIGGYAAVKDLEKEGRLKDLLGGIQRIEI